MKIPFVDLKTQYQNIKNQIDTAIANVINETAFIKGKYVIEFEQNFAKEYGVKHCIGVSDGTAAIYIVLKMLNIGQGDEVITVANSWISTSETISQTGATPVFVDTEKDFFNIDVNLIEQKITKKTKAIIPVHLYGQAANIEKIQALCESKKIILIEDCAQAHFASFNGKKVGTFGLAATFSFYPGKNLGAYGDAGAIITNDDDLAQKVRMYANHGALKKHEHLIEGVNSRLDGLQAAILNAKLPYIHEWNEQRLNNALFYNKLLSEVPQIISPKIREGAKHVFHVYCIKAEKRDVLNKFLNENGIETAIHYPIPLPFMKAYEYLNHKSEEFPIVAKQQNQILSLPMFPELTMEQMNYVVEKIKLFYTS